MNRKTKFTYLLSLILCVALIAAALSGCSGGSAQSGKDSASGQSKILTMATGHEINTLYPLNMDPQNNITTKLCYDTLVNYVDGKVVPSLAESWSFSEDGKALTFVLKQGVTFHDGKPFNAEAVKAVFEFAHLNPNFGGIKAVANLERVDAVDAYTVTFHYPTPYFAYLTDFCYPEVMTLVSPSVLEEGNYQTMKGVVGTGAYKYEEIKNGEFVRFVRNPEYWGAAPYYDEVIVKYIPEASTRVQALKNGEVDMIYGNVLLSWDDYEQALALPNVEGLISSTDSETRNLVLNASGQYLSELKVREAVAYAIDKKALSQGLTYGHENAAKTLFPSGIPYTDTVMNTTRTFNLEKAGKLLDESGWLLNTATGVREKDGKPLSLTFTYDSGEIMNKALSTIIKSQLAEAGISVETEGQEMYTWWKEGVAGNYDITIWNTEQPYTSPHNFFTPMLSASPHTLSLDVIPEGDAFKNLIKEFQTTDDPARVTEIFDSLLNISNDEVMNIPLTYIKEMIVYNKDRIAGYTFTSTPMFFDITGLQPVQ
ncbi:MAG: extracellular solute-binding protein family 5 [Bacillota bacterium]|jgi:peptide/nickel transport system substrate-binding protein/nickel transport system substrate-binding protein|nr:extracellular solute-binding protein family 5 [Bacillota bacterium]